MKLVGYGYGHAKQALFELVCESFLRTTRALHLLYVQPRRNRPSLAVGAKKAAAVADAVLGRVREK